MNKNLPIVDFVRVIAVISIVIWHCSICPYLCWNIVEPTELYASFTYPILRTLSNFFFPEAVMPLFTFISGFLFSLLMAKGKYEAFLPFLWNKVRRLLIPFFVIGTLVTITSYDRYLQDIIWGEGSHLWYCTMLFWCFIITWIICKYIQNYLYVIFLLSICLQIYYGSNWLMGFKLPLGIHNSFYFIGYFIFGYVINMKFSIVKKLREHLLVFVLLYFVIASFNLLSLSIINRFISIFLNYFYSLLLITLSYAFSLNVSETKGTIKSICKNSFGIYVFHEWISWNFCHIPVIVDIIRDHYILFPIFNFVWIFIVSYVITGILLKTKIGNFLF